jgi:DNA (cytosine-5)-methyltransferase 1
MIIVINAREWEAEEQLSFDTISLATDYPKEEKESYRKAGLKVISLFSGAGGLDIGFENAGFTIAVAVEADPACCDTLRTNRPSLPIINERVENLSVKDILQKADLRPLEAALVIGGPPCQSFSLAGLRKGLDDERGKLLFEFVRIVRGALPFGFVLENVKGLGSWDSGNALKLLIDELSKPVEYNEHQYTYTIAEPKIMNAVDFDVPQFRERIVIVGNRRNLRFYYPKKTLNRSLPTVWSAIGDLPEPEPPSETAIRVSTTIKGRREKHGY